MMNNIPQNMYNNQQQYLNQPNMVQPNLVQSTVAQNGNFGAIDTEKLKQDTAEIAEKQVKENWLFRTLRNTFGIQDPKKFTISAALTLVTVIGCAILGNKVVNKTTEEGIKVGEKLTGNKFYNTVSTKLKNAAQGVKNFVLEHSKTAKNISETLKDRAAKSKLDITRGYGQGWRSIFSLTPVDILKKAFASQKAEYLNATDDITKQRVFDSIKNSVSKLVGGEKAGEFTSQILENAGEKMTNIEFCSRFSEAMRENFGCGQDHRKFYEVLRKLGSGNIDGVDVSEFTNVHMKGGGFIGSWWPVNILNKITSVVTGKPSNFGRGQLGDSLIKFNAVNGTLADTKLGQLVQKSVIVPTESISNFVNDKSGLGVLLCSSVMSTYNSAQEAPKGEKVATVADSFVGSIGSLAISTPLAFKTTYALASLANLKDNQGFISTLLKKAGKVFALGLDKINPETGEKIVNTSKLKGFAGGALRFYLIMFVFSKLFSKPINAAIHKVFGTPGAQKQKELEAQKINQVKINNQQSVQQNNTPQVMPVDTQPVPQQVVYPSQTNLINKWTQLPQQAQQTMIAQQPIQTEQPVQRYIPTVNIPASGIAAQPTLQQVQPQAQQINSQNQQNQPVAALNIFNRDKNKEKYIPTIEPPQQAQNNDAEVQNYVNQILKKTDSVINETRKYL